MCVFELFPAIIFTTIKHDIVKWFQFLSKKINICKTNNKMWKVSGKSQARLGVNGRNPLNP